jgi:hypothetical protein
MINKYNFSTTMNESIVEKIKKLSDGITRLLDTQQNDYDEIEQFIYHTAIYHFNDLNIKYDKEKHYIEFWCKYEVDLNGFHIDCNEMMKDKLIYEYPLLSTVSYFCSMNNYPFALTTIDLEKYMYKNFENEKNIYLVFPNNNTQIAFNKPYYHGVLDINTVNNIIRPIIAINLWNKPPTNVEYYKKPIEITKNININIEITKVENTYINIPVEDNMFNYNTYNNILYYRNNKLLINNELIAKITNNLSNIIVLTQNNGAAVNDIINKKKNIITEIVSDELKIFENRFIQRFNYSSIFSKDICDWIIYETEKYASIHGWTTKRHNLYPTTDIPVERIVSVYNYILFGLIKVINLIKTSYCLPDINLNIIDLFIVKYEETQQTYLDFHTDSSMISFNIALNEMNEYEGGGTGFKDGLIIKLNKGDLLIHSSKVMHAGIPITKGKRYILVGFINI